MTKNIALIKNGVVENIAVFGPESPDTIEGYTLVDVTGRRDVGIGWLYTNGTFAPPAPTE